MRKPRGWGWEARPERRDGASAAAWGPSPASPREGHSPTSKGRPHGEIVVLHSEERPSLPFPDFGHIEVLLRKVTAETRETHFSMAHQARSETDRRGYFLQELPLGTFSLSGSNTQTPSHPSFPSLPQALTGREDQTPPEPFERKHLPAGHHSTWQALNCQKL